MSRYVNNIWIDVTDDIYINNGHMGFMLYYSIMYYYYTSRWLDCMLYTPYAIIIFIYLNTKRLWNVLFGQET